MRILQQVTNHLSYTFLVGDLPQFPHQQAHKDLHSLAPYLSFQPHLLPLSSDALLWSLTTSKPAGCHHHTLAPAHCLAWHALSLTCLAHFQSLIQRSVISFVFYFPALLLRIKVLCLVSTARCSGLYYCSCIEWQRLVFMSPLFLSDEFLHITRNLLSLFPYSLLMFVIW